MHPGVLAVNDAQKAGCLLEGFVTQAAYPHQVAAAPEDALLLPMADDVLGGRGIEAGYACQQRNRGSIQVHANGVDAILNHGVERPRQLHLGDVMLVLAHTYGLGINLDQLSQWVLESPGNGDGAPDGDIQVRQLPRCVFRS